MLLTSTPDATATRARAAVGAAAHVVAAEMHVEFLAPGVNKGAALVPLLVSSSIARWGWKAALYAPAAASCVIAAVLGLLLYGSPERAAARGDGFVLGLALPQAVAQALAQALA